jgi:hypothetical protein
MYQIAKSSNAHSGPIEERPCLRRRLAARVCSKSQWSSDTILLTVNDLQNKGNLPFVRGKLLDFAGTVALRQHFEKMMHFSLH